MQKSKRIGSPMVKGYGEAGASEVRRALKGFIPRSGAPNEDIDWNNRTLRQRGRMLYMASPVATSAIDTNRTKVVGTGLTLKSVVNREFLGMSPESAKAWQRTTESEFALWAGGKDCDATGLNNFNALQQLALKSWLMSGDVFALIKRGAPTPTNPYTLRVHLIEADRVSTPDAYGGIAGSLRFTDGVNPDNGNKVCDGVEIDGNGRAVAYHVRNTYPDQIASEPAKWVRVEATGPKTGLPNILHIMSSERPDQYRGVTYLAQVIEPLLQLRRYTESELTAALIQSFFTAWIKTETDKSENPINETGGGDIVNLPGDEPEEPEETPKNPNEYDMGPGDVLHLGENEDVTFGNPNIPTAGFESFVKTICKIVGAGLEMPYDVLVKEYNASYSAARAALLEAWEAFRMRRAWFVDDFCKPLYEIWLAEAVASGRVKAPGFFKDPRIRAAWCGTHWIGPVQGQIDPTKEVKAAVIGVDRGFKTHEQVTRELGGGDWEANAEQLALENTKLREAGGGNYMASLDDGDAKDGESKGDGGDE